MILQSLPKSHSESYSLVDGILKRIVALGLRLQVQDARLWWPRHMAEVPGYLYTIVVEVLSKDGSDEQRPQNLRKGDVMKPFFLTRFRDVNAREYSRPNPKARQQQHEQQ